MYCKKCGLLIDDDSVYCSNCGTKQSYSPTNQIPTPLSDSKTVNVNLTFGRPSNPSEKVERVKIEKYDLTYKKESDATITGVVLLLITIIFILSGISIDPVYSNIISIIFLALRIGIVVWCVNIAKRQNRDSILWGIFSFLLPSLSLIIIGTLHKLKKRSKVESIITETKEEEDLKNYLYPLQLYDGTIMEIKSTLGVGYSNGDLAFINGEPAKDGKYKIGALETITILNGKIQN